MMAFVMKAVAQSLKLHPTINASIDMDAEQIIYKDYVNIGVAVDTERGLVVPTIRDVDRLSIPANRQGADGRGRTGRGGKFSLDELRGSTFTISNMGAIGGTYSTPIINPPNVAILLTGRSRKLPVVVDDSVEPRLMMPLSLSYDHRLVDGAAAARFLNEVINYLKVPGRLLLRRKCWKIATSRPREACLPPSRSTPPGLARAAQTAETIRPDVFATAEVSALRGR